VRHIFKEAATDLNLNCSSVPTVRSISQWTDSQARASRLPQARAKEYWLNASPASCLKNSEAPCSGTGATGFDLQAVENSCGWRSHPPVVVVDIGHDCRQGA
jgi:hypothetical protein